jgi:hypothetical protein
MKRAALIILAVMALYPLMAQIDAPKPMFSPNATTSSGFFSLNKIHMAHSLGFQAGTSSTGNGFYMSRYTNHINYKFNPKLELDLDLNFVNFGTTASGFEFNADNKSRVIPEFSLRYKPSDSFQLNFEFRQAPGFWDYQRPWYERW